MDASTAYFCGLLASMVTPTGRMVAKPVVLALPIRSVKASLVLTARICASPGAIGLAPSLSASASFMKDA